MKKILVFLSVFFLGLGAFASDADEVRAYFNSFVDSGNSYKSNYFGFYDSNPKIIRVVIKKDGTKTSVVVPLSQFKKHSSLNTKLGKIRRYKNTYSNIQITPQGQNYMVTAMRKPSTSDYSLPAYFIIGKDESGSWKIKEESMHTKVQSFLNHK